MKNRSGIFLFVIYLIAMTAFITGSHAANEAAHPSNGESAAQKKTSSLLLPTPKPNFVPPPNNEETLQKEAFFKKLNTITHNIKLLRKEVEEKSNLLREAKTEEKKNKILLEIEAINQTIAEQEKSFEMVQTAGLELAEVEASQVKAFDWKKDLLEILQPIMNELRQLTEDKRKLVNLQNKIGFHKSQIRDISKALEQMSRINKDGLEEDALEQFEQINKKWQNLLEDNNHLLGIAQLKLDGMIKSQTEEEISFGEYAKQFASGRGATLLMAVMAFVMVYFSMALLWKGIMLANTRRQKNRPSYLQRIVTLIYHAAMVIFSITVVFYVLNVRNDQVLIGVAVLLLIIVVLVLRNSIPRYIKELQILLNAGSVREDEHIIYNGIPMKVTSLNFYTKLTNPALPGLVLKLPLSEMSNYISRQYSEDEPWFPCQHGDFVMLSDGTYGKVTCITLENIIISLANGMSPKTYAIKDFLANNPKNLSKGFVATSVIGIDYKYQSQCTSYIPELFCVGIRERLLKEAYASSLENFWVFFDQANTSSLDFKIVAIFDGKAAGDYFSIIRALHRYAVDVCNQQQWEIPFTQVVIHNNQTL